MANGDNGVFQVTIDFIGICAHFLDNAAGVPHRVVLPQTNKVAGGNLQTGTNPQVMDYGLEPHIGFVCHQDSGEPVRVEAPPGLWDGVVVKSVRLQIINAIDSDLVYQDSFRFVPSLVTYMPGFRQSDAVVVGGQAQCYFDILGGTVSAEIQSAGAVHTLVTMTTDGPPRLQIKPLDVSTDAGEPWQRDMVIGPTLVVANTSHACTDARFDFMWHYLTNRDGIPTNLAEPPPGLDVAAAPGEEDHCDASSKRLKEGFPGDFVRRVTHGETTASCSNSHYP